MTETEIEKKWENTVWDTDIYLDDLDGKEPMTNEEWLRSATTEQLAEKLWEIYDAGKEDAKTYDTFEYFIDKEDVVEWLKQPHKDGEA